MITWIVTLIASIKVWFDAYNAMNDNDTDGNFNILVYFITKYMRWPIIAMLVEVIVVLVLGIILALAGGVEAW